MEKTKGSYKADEVLIREQVEQQFRETLAFKDIEIESINTKLQRISQTNIELKTKNDRLETSNQ